MSCVIITGSSRGIGFGMAKEFLARHDNVIINGTTDDSVNEASKKLIKYENQVGLFVGKVEDPLFAEKIFSYANNLFGEVKIWVNNAGINQPLLKAWEIDHTQIQKLIQVNIFAIINATSIVYRLMDKQGFGKIFNMEGLGSDGRIIDNTALYGTSKRALNYFTKAFASECKNSNIQVGIISPGMVITDFILHPINSQTKEEADKTKKVFNVLGSKVEQVAPFLVSNMLTTKKHYPCIRYLTNQRVIMKLIQYVLNRQNYFID